MIPVKLRLVGIGPYEDETIDLERITGALTAIAGENGSGKTFLFDSVFAALYRYFPSRGSVYEYCRGKAQISLNFKVGSVEYRSVLNIDPKKRETEPWLFCNGEAITDGKNSTFDNEVKRICGDDKVVLTSTFSSQNKSGSFGELSKADRKSLFISMLGQEKLQKVSDIASSMEATSSEKYNQATGLVEGYRVIVDTEIADLEALRNSLETARADISRYEVSVKEKQGVVVDLKGKVFSTTDLEGRKFTLLKRKQLCDKDISDTERALEEAKKLAGKLEDLKKISVKHEEITKQQEDRQTQISSLLVEQSEFHQMVSAYKEVIHGLETELNSKKELYKRSQNDLSRATNDSKIISKVPCGAKDDFAKCQFLTNAIKSRDSIEELGETIVACQAQALALEDKIKGTPRPDGEVLASIEKRISDLRKEI